jgi:hypothetical protein
MPNKPSIQDDGKFINPVPGKRAAQTHGSSDSSRLVSALREDAVPGSEAVPANKSYLERINLNLVGGIILVLAILILIIFVLTGPGRAGLERNLAGLIDLEDTSTPMPTPSPLPTKTKTPEPTRTSSPSPTLKPSSTKEIVVYPSSTIRAVIKTTSYTKTATQNTSPTPTPRCRDARTISLADVGQTLCVQGVVIETITNPTNFLVIFSTEKGAFYWVTYDLIWAHGEVDACYAIEGKIQRLANSPVLVFDYSNLPKECP